MLEELMKGIGILLGLLVLILLIVFVPFLVIWSLNTLFSLGIGYTIWTWIAVVILVFIINPTVKRETDDS